MKTKQKLSILSIILLLAALACSLTPDTGGEATIPGDMVETSVAQTLAAESGENGESGTEPAPMDETPTTPTTEPETPLHVAYIDDGDLWLWTEAGGNVELYTGETVNDLLLSPDGEVVAFTTIGADYLITGLWRIFTDGTGLQKLVSSADFLGMATGDAIGAAPYLWQFIPGTHTVAFNTKLLFEGPGLLIQGDLRHVNLDTGALSIFLPAGEAGNFYYSPDGSRIAMTTPTSISLINADGSNRQDDVVTFDFVNTASEAAFYPAPRWAADSSRLWALIPSSQPFEPDATFEVFEVSSNGETVSSLGVYPSEAAHFNSAQAISPDGNHVAYLQRVGDARELHIAQFGGGDTNYSPAVEGIKGWSLDSAHFLYGRQVGETWIGTLGGVPELLDGGTSVGDVVWLPDGQFVYSSGTYGAFSIRLGTLGAGSILIASPASDFAVFDVAP